MKIKWIAIVLSAVLVVGAGIGVGIGIYRNQPENVAEGAMMDVLEGFAARREIAPLANMLTEGSFSLAYNGIRVEDRDLFGGLKLGGKLFFSQSAVMLQGFRFENGDVKLAGDLYSSDKMLYLYEKEVLKGAYGVEYTRISEEFKNSIFAYDSNSKYAIGSKADQEKLEKYWDIQNTDYSKDTMRLVVTVSRDLWDIICANLVFEATDEEVYIHGEREKVRAVTVTLDANTSVEIMLDVYDYLSQNEDIKAFLTKYDEELTLLFEVDEANKDKTVAQLYEELLEKVEEKLDRLSQKIEDAFNGRTLSVRLITPRFRHTLVMLDAMFGGQELFALEIGMDGIEETDKITLHMDGEKYFYEVTEDTDESFKSALKSPSGSIELSWDKGREKYTLKIKSKGTSENEWQNMDWTFTGKVIVGEGKKTITLDKILIDEGEAKCDICIVIDEKDEMPAAPTTFTTLSQITEAKMDALGEALFGKEENY